MTFFTQNLSRNNQRFEADATEKEWSGGESCHRGKIRLSQKATVRIWLGPHKDDGYKKHPQRYSQCKAWNPAGGA